MAKKQSCPQCGAVNKGDRYRCRLCGHVLDKPPALAAGMKKAPRHFLTNKPKYSITVLIPIGAAIVAVLVGVGVYFGLVRNEYIDQAIAIVQNQRESPVRGWTEVAPDDSGVVAALPGPAETIQSATDQYPTALTDGSMLSNGFDPSDTAYVIWGRAASPSATSSFATLERTVNSYAEARGGEARNTAFGEKSGKEALFFDVVYPGTEPRYTKGFAILDNDWIAMGVVDSTTPTNPLYDTFSGQYRFVGR